MALPDSITLATINGEVVFENKTKNGSVATYYADSPHGDLSGRPTLVVSQETTKAGIAKATVTITTPVLNGITGKYDSFLKNSISSTQSGLQTTAGREDQLSMLQSFLELHTDNLAEGDV